MNSAGNFGQGIFEDPRPVEKAPEPSPAPEPTAPEPEQELSTHILLQQERDREKAMLLRRTREEPATEVPEPERKPSPPPWQRERERGPRFDRSRRGGRPQVEERRPDAFSAAGGERGSSVETAPFKEPGGPPVPFREAEERERPSFAERRTTQTAPQGSVLLDQRGAVLVDVQNMYHSARKLHGRNLSYSKLLQQTVKGRKLIRAIAYLLDREGVDQGAFLDHLGNCGFEVRRKELIERADGSRKGDWDLGIAADAIALADKVDVLILVSGDGDFVSLAQLLRQRGVKLEIASFRESTSDALIASADGFNALGKDSLY